MSSLLSQIPSKLKTLFEVRTLLLVWTFGVIWFSLDLPCLFEILILYLLFENSEIDSKEIQNWNYFVYRVDLEWIQNWSTSLYKSYGGKQRPCEIDLLQIENMSFHKLLLLRWWNESKTASYISWH